MTEGETSGTAVPDPEDGPRPVLGVEDEPGTEARAPGWIGRTPVAALASLGRGRSGPSSPSSRRPDLRPHARPGPAAGTAVAGGSADVARREAPPPAGRTTPGGGPYVVDAHVVGDYDEQPGLPLTLLRAVLAAVYQVGRGHLVWLRRLADALTNAAAREQIRESRATGDQIALAEWMDRHEAMKDARRERIRKLPETIGAAIGAAFALAAAAGAALLIVGTVIGLTRPLGWTWGGYWGLLGTIADVLLAALVVAIWVAACSLPLVWPFAAHRAGRAEGDVPAWLGATRLDDEDVVPITPAAVVVALRDLGLRDLRNAIRDMPDGGAGMLGPIVIAGCGVLVDVALPSGTSTYEILNRRRKLAENLHRHEHELFITIPPAARTVRLWAAEPGALDEPIGPSPLVIDPDIRADYYTGRAPWGQDLRGDAALMRLLQCHVLITGLSNQGKTACLRALALWLAFDPPVEYRIGDLKGIGDWSMFENLATTLIQGPTDEHVVAVTEMVEDAVREMERRTEAVKRTGSTKGVTRDMARSGQGFHPLVVIVDEAQVAFMCPQVDEYKQPYGGTKHTSRYFMAVRKIHNQGRAVNVTMWQGTQDPTDQNLPKLVREGAHIRGSLVVGTESQARMALGDKAVNGGAAPHKLRQGLDKGTLVVTGEGVPLPPGEPSITIRTHFIDGDQAVAVAERAKGLRKLVITKSGTAAEPVDHLADICDALRGEPRVRTQTVLARLAEANPAYYQNWTFQRLATVLDDHGVAVKKSDGFKVVRLEDVRQALTERDWDLE